MEIRITETHLTTGSDGELWDGYVMAVWENNHIEFVEPVRLELDHNCDEHFGCDGYNFHIQTPWGKLKYCTEGEYPVALIH